MKYLIVAFCSQSMSANVLPLTWETTNIAADWLDGSGPHFALCRGNTYGIFRCRSIELDVWRTCYQEYYFGKPVEVH